MPYKVYKEIYLHQDHNLDLLTSRLIPNNPGFGFQIEFIQSDQEFMQDIPWIVCSFIPFRAQKGRYPAGSRLIAREMGSFRNEIIIESDEDRQLVSEFCPFLNFRKSSIIVEKMSSVVDFLTLIRTSKIMFELRNLQK